MSVFKHHAKLETNVFLLAVGILLNVAAHLPREAALPTPPCGCVTPAPGAALPLFSGGIGRR